MLALLTWHHKIKPTRISTVQDSLGGNTKTMMVACLSPADNNYDETVSTLRYANRAKQIKNKPKINEDPKDTLLREYAEEIKKLKEQLESAGGPAQVKLEKGESAGGERAEGGAGRQAAGGLPCCEVTAVVVVGCSVALRLGI